MEMENLENYENPFEPKKEVLEEEREKILSRLNVLDKEIRNLVDQIVEKQARGAPLKRDLNRYTAALAKIRKTEGKSYKNEEPEGNISAQEANSGNGSVKRDLSVEPEEKSSITHSSKDNTYMLLKENDKPNGIHLMALMTLYKNLGIRHDHKQVSNHLAALIEEEKIYQINPFATQSKRYRAKTSSNAMLQIRKETTHSIIRNCGLHSGITTFGVQQKYEGLKIKVSCTTVRSHLEDLIKEGKIWLSSPAINRNRCFRSVEE